MSQEDVAVIEDQEFSVQTVKERWLEKSEKMAGRFTKEYDEKVREQRISLHEKCLISIAESRFIRCPEIKFHILSPEDKLVVDSMALKIATRIKQWTWAAIAADVVVAAGIIVTELIKNEAFLALFIIFLALFIIQAGLSVGMICQELASKSDYRTIIGGSFRFLSTRDAWLEHMQKALRPPEEAPEVAADS